MFFFLPIHHHHTETVEKRVEVPTCPTCKRPLNNSLHTQTLVTAAMGGSLVSLPLDIADVPKPDTPPTLDSKPSSGWVW